MVEVTAKRYSATAPLNRDAWMIYKLETVDLNIQEHNGDDWVFVIGTPYSARAELLEKGKDWTACNGTVWIPGGRAYDRVVIPAEEWQKVFE
jgi:hypothetical protein